MNLTLTFAISIHFALYFPVSVFCRFQGYTLLVYFFGDRVWSKLFLASFLS